MNQHKKKPNHKDVKHRPASPHGDLMALFPDIWFVQGGVRMPMWMPMKIGRSMTVVRNPSGELTLINSMRLSESGLEQLQALGRIAHVLRIAGFHGRDDGFYRDRYGATVYALEGHRYLREMNFQVGPEKEYTEADVYLNEHSPLPFPDARLKLFPSSDPPEAVLLMAREGGIMVTGDSLQHTATADKYFNFIGRYMMKKFGFIKPYNVGPGWIQFAEPTREDIRALLKLEFAHVLPGHGAAVIGNAKEKYRPTLEGELAGCGHDKPGT